MDNCNRLHQDEFKNVENADYKEAHDLHRNSKGHQDGEHGDNQCRDDKEDDQTLAGPTIEAAGEAERHTVVMIMKA